MLKSSLLANSKANVFKRSRFPQTNKRIREKTCMNLQNPIHQSRLSQRKNEGIEINMTLKQACSIGDPRSTRCIQRFDDSLNSAIHTTYRISLRSSSMREPRDPLLKVVLIHFYFHSTRQR